MRCVGASLVDISPRDGTHHSVTHTPGNVPAVPSRRWRPGTGIYVVAPLQPSLTTTVAEIQTMFDPKLARLMAPHITIVGSSGAGPIAPDTPVGRLRAAIEPIAASTAPLTLELGHPIRFMQTDIIVLPLNPHGPLRTLHERIRESGLTYARPRFAFTPHITLSFYRELSPADRRSLLAIRVDEPVQVTQIECSLSREPQPARHLVTFPLRGTSA